MVDKTTLYNLALESIRETRLVDLSETREARYSLDLQFPTAQQFMLEGGFWKFGMRSIKIDADASITPAFGMSMAFNKPDDWVKTYLVSLDPYMRADIGDILWEEEGGNIFCDSGPIYMRYVSNSSDGYGQDMTRWTARFITAFADELAWRIAPKITGSSDALMDKLNERRTASMSDARGFEAIREPARRVSEGQWNRSRFRAGGSSDRIGSKLYG